MSDTNLLKWKIRCKELFQCTDICCIVEHCYLYSCLWCCYTVMCQIGWLTLKEEFNRMLGSNHTDKDQNVFDDLKAAVRDESMKKHKWDEKAEDSLVHCCALMCVHHLEISQSARQCRTVVRATSLVNGTTRFVDTRDRKPLNRSTSNLTGVIMSGTPPHMQTLVFLSPRGAVVHMRDIVIIRVYFLHPFTFLFLVHL